MEIIFEITEKSGRRIHLSKERWRHIRMEHPDITNYEIIEETIKHPLKIISKEENIVIYYRYFKHKQGSAKFLKIIVKYLNGNGYVITSYFVKNI